jgi:hypothetical protein
MNGKKMDSKRKKEMAALNDRLVNVLTEFCQIAGQCKGEDGFLRLFSMLGGNKVPSLTPVNIIRYFDPQSKKFRGPRDPVYFLQEMRKGLVKDIEFMSALENFKPFAKGCRGGLKRFKKEILTEREERVDILKLYLKLSREKYLSRRQEETLLQYRQLIPEDIRNKLKPRGFKMLAFDWMAAEWNCSIHTLQQAIYRSSERIHS